MIVISGSKPEAFYVPGPGAAAATYALLHLIAPRPPQAAAVGEVRLRTTFLLLHQCHDTLAATLRLPGLWQSGQLLHQVSSQCQHTALRLISSCLVTKHRSSTLHPFQASSSYHLTAFIELALHHQVPSLIYVYTSCRQPKRTWLRVLPFLSRGLRTPTSIEGLFTPAQIAPPSPQTAPLQQLMLTYFQAQA